MKWIWGFLGLFLTFLNIFLPHFLTHFLFLFLTPILVFICNLECSTQLFQTTKFLSSWVRYNINRKFTYRQLCFHHIVPFRKHLFHFVDVLYALTLLITLIRCLRERVRATVESCILRCF